MMEDAPKAMPHYLAMHAERMVDNGYTIVPILPGEKRPGQWDQHAKIWRERTGWQKLARGAFHPDIMLKGWLTSPPCGVGILTGVTKGKQWGVVALDADLGDAEVSSTAQTIAFEKLGPTPAVRIGQHPKALLVYRVEEDFAKIQMAPIECLASGQQFVAYGIHPKTGKPYQWIDEEIADLDVESLPLVTEAQMRDCMEAIYAIIPEAMKPPPLLKLATMDGEHVAGDLEGDPEAIAECLARIPNPDLSWDDWNKIGMALYAAHPDKKAAWEMFREFSARSSKFDAKETSKRWQSFKRSPPTRVGMGTLVHLANELGETPIPADVPFNKAKRDAKDFDISGVVEKAQAPVMPWMKPKPERPKVDDPIDVAAEAEAIVTPTAQQKNTFPMEWLETQSLVGEIARWICQTAMYPQPPFAIGNTLALLGSLFGRRYRLKFFGVPDARCNLYALGIGGTGVGKDHSRKCVNAILSGARMKQFAAGGKVTSEAALRALLAQHPSRIANMDELGTELKGMTGRAASGPKATVIQGLLTLFSDSNTTSYGTDYADTKVNARIDLECPNLNVYFTSQPETLLPALTSEMVNNGLLNRVLFLPAFNEGGEFDLREIDMTPPDAIVAKIKDIMSLVPAGAGNMATGPQLADLEPQLIDVVFDGMETAYLYRDFVRFQNRETAKGRKILGRVAEYSLKLAMIEAIARDPIQPVIDREIYEMARGLAQWCFEYADGLIQREVSDNETERQVKKVANLIHDAGAAGITGNLLYRKTQGMNKNERISVLHTLVEGGQVREERLPTKGRPAFIYFWTGEQS